MFRSTKIPFLALLFSLLILAPMAMAQGAPAKSSPKYEAWLHQEVRHRLLLLPWYTVFDILQYSINGYDVTLKGAVVNPTLKSGAENAVKGIEGVEKVNNEIEVLPPSPMDNRIRFAEYRAIYSAPSLQRYGIGNLQSIHIIVKNGHVTLDGYVDSQADKNEANIKASTVANVFSVTDNLRVGEPK